MKALLCQLFGHDNWISHCSGEYRWCVRCGKYLTMDDKRQWRYYP